MNGLRPKEAELAGLAELESPRKCLGGWRQISAGNRLGRSSLHFTAALRLRAMTSWRVRRLAPAAAQFPLGILSFVFQYALFEGINLQ